MDKDTIKLHFPSDQQIETKILRTMADSWSVQIDSKLGSHLQGKSQLPISFQEEKKVYMGKADIIKIDQENNSLIIARPQKLTSRAARKEPRVQVQLPAAIIIMSDETRPEQFIGRGENRIINISFSGAKIACKTALAEDCNDLLIMTCLSKEETTIKDKQVYIRSVKVRDAGASPLAEFPYSYGIEFDLKFPEFRSALGEFLTTIL